MSDSEDENYVSFGNPLEPLDEDNLPRKRAITAADQCVYDTEGRRRFHGAFTGGFSAGYFNGVGSRDGWTPKRFKSSRAERTAGVVQRPEDFMDEEDTGQFGIAPTAIRTTGGYQDLDKAGANTLRRRQAQQDILFEEGPIPGAPVLGEILRPARDTVGVILLKKMGWRPGQGVGARVTRREKRDMRRRTNRMKKVYGCAGPPGQDSLFRTSTDESANEEEDDDSDENSTITFAPDDYEPFRREPKDNLFGIGYTGLDRHTVLSDSRERKAVLAESFFRQEKDRRIAKHGRAFGVGAFEEEDEDIYAQDDMSRYDFTLAPEDAGRKSTRSRERVTGNTAAGLEGFTRAASGLCRPDADTAGEKTRRQRKFFPPPVLPANFNPVHATSRFSPRPMMTRIEKRPIRSVVDRAAILDEKSRGPLTASERNTSDADEGRKEDEKKSVRELEKERSKGASAWLEKLQDCQSFVTGGLLTRTGAEQKEETSANVEHAETSAEMPADGGVEESRRKAAKLKMFGKLTRERVEWRACSIVYKRFNIHEPKDDAKPESGIQRKSVKFSLLSKSIDFLSAGNEKKEIFSRKTEVAEDAKKTEMQLVEEASHSRMQEDSKIESVALLSTEPSSSRSPLPTPFEVSYEKIFGKAISGDAVGGSKGEPSEKKDLFKAIFLDSEDEDHASDQKEKEKEGDSMEDEQEAMKSILIGSIVERKPSFSPPRGIFSNLDKLDKKKEWTREKNVSEKEHEDSSRVSLNVQDPGCLPENTYGPALPSTSTNNHHQRGQKTENSHKQVLYKSVVVPSRSENAIEERWVELKRAKKSKKEKKKKRKHKESKKSKKESSRRRKH